MKPLSVKSIRAIISGELVHGSDEVMVQYGAYRLKQVKNQYTILFTSGRIVNWKSLKDLFPLVVATDYNYSRFETPEDVTVIKVTI